MDKESSYEIFDAAIRQALKKFWNISCYDDLYQECYCKILDVLKNNTYEPIFNLYGYAYKIARNAISTYLYHEKKIVTLSQEEFPEIPVSADMDCQVLLEEAADYLLERYATSIPEGLTQKDIIKLLDDPDPSSLVLTVIKGELIWYIANSIK